MKVLIDVSAGFSVGQVFAERGYDVVYVRDRDPKMKDEDILNWAVTEQRLVVTQDKDFGELVFRKSLAHAGILLLRLDEANSDKKRDIVSEILDGYANKLPGRFSVFQDDRLRIR